MRRAAAATTPAALRPTLAAPLSVAVVTGGIIVEVELQNGFGTPVMKEAVVESLVSEE